MLTRTSSPNSFVLTLGIVRTSFRLAHWHESNESCFIKIKTDASASVFIFTNVPRTGLEPAQDCSHIHLKDARLPISPPGQHSLQPGHCKDFLGFCKLQTQRAPALPAPFVLGNLFQTTLSSLLQLLFSLLPPVLLQLSQQLP